ncbi:unnamed protein product [Aureobasidium vineae]|uniref:RBR-type E3 ubiquitin transferase n=1 Tax=Aureobasidium vineae TaxID=2773715 RepID=A0A9N8JN73_9PEZI|nr:unnamed protein product [Aureobasidium vineae]
MEATLAEALWSTDQEAINLAWEIERLDTHPTLELSTIVTIVDAAPDEEAQVQAVLVRLAQRGDYDPLITELAIATVGPHDTDAIVDFLDYMTVRKIDHTQAACGKKLIRCVACEEQLPPKDLILTSCGHCYCGSCLSMVFNAAVSDESLYPPRCCANKLIPLEHAVRFLEPEFGTKFEEKGLEYETIDRTYCSDPTCSTFIHPDGIYSIDAQCSSCGKETCVICKAPAHGGDCPADLDLAALLRFAEEMHWQRCYNCLRVVQRQDGCNHME